jgi:hypothetical protein
VTDAENYALHLCIARPDSVSEQRAAEMARSLAGILNAAHAIAAHAAKGGSMPPPKIDVQTLALHFAAYTEASIKKLDEVPEWVQPPPQGGEAPALGIPVTMNAREVPAQAVPVVSAAPGGEPIDVPPPIGRLEFEVPPEAGIAAQMNAGDLQSPAVVWRAADMSAPALDAGALGESITITRTATVTGLDIEPAPAPVPAENKGAPIEPPSPPTGAEVVPVKNFKPYTVASSGGENGWVISERGEPVLVTRRGGLRSGARALAERVADLLNANYAEQPYRVEPVRLTWHTGIGGGGSVCHENEGWILTGPGIDDLAAERLGFGEDGRGKLQELADGLNDGRDYSVPVTPRPGLHS